MILYRAAENDSIMVGYSFAGRRQDAESYLDNPGFGGPILYRCRVTLSGVIDLTAGWDALSEAIGEEVIPAKWGYHFARTVTASDVICERLASRGYQWAMIVDDYPEGCITYVPLTPEAADAAEEAMVEVVS